ncbi:probable Histone acetyltransferase esa-1 [Cephalotrichum gorgonifer]|uniref:Histone acetyltransferase ESA1 n=1 Tax=Cephalotrichum gorgonifer TaxID=2041049 RepID=A0AAE8N1Q3_9PEZI|nr:probable Histone acetyltransferase esa-1 [Cephalotrichum gorgonifer]
MVEKDGQHRRAEILSIRDTKRGRQFYCNFDNFNKRLDEWVPVSRIDFTQDIEWPNPEKDKQKDGKLKKGTSQPAKKTVPPKKGQKRPAKREQSVPSETTTPHPWTEWVETQGQPPGGAKGEDKDVSQPATPGIAVVAPDGEAPAADNSTFNREEEVEKLRTSGSMTQNPAEIARIRNINKVQMGEWDLIPWYFSPYPEALNDCDLVYICEFCLSWRGDLKSFTRHRQKCTLRHPPGNEIYRDENVSFFEIDGRRQRTWCRNLCLLSKMFLDHKTLYYDVDPFLFYVMTRVDEKGHHVVGYFSKEKESAEGYNVACILTLPQYQRKGYGRLLIQFSYELSKIEGKLGSPEKPLSDLGLLSYRQFWSENILDMLIQRREDDAGVSIENISSELVMTVKDVEHTLHFLKLLVYHRGQHKIVLHNKLVQQQEKQRARRRRVIDPARIQWTPPVFSAASKTWAW